MVKSIKFILIFLFIGFMFWFFTYPPPPITYDGAYKQIYNEIQQHCKQLNYQPCDYKLVKFDGDKETGIGVFYFESSYGKPIAIRIYGDGDTDFWDSKYINPPE